MNVERNNAMKATNIMELDSADSDSDDSDNRMNRNNLETILNHEQNENNAGKSLIIDCEMSSNNTDVTPVIDTGRMSFIAVGNKLNKIDTSADWYPTADFRASTEPDGDNNACIYLTKKVTLENAATAIKVFSESISQYFTSQKNN